MSADNQKSMLAILNEGIRKWRKAAGLSSNEAIGDLIVQAHYKHGFDITTGITFLLDGNDEYHRMHMNAQKIFRWLDGETKATNMLNVNFVPSILADMPSEIKQETINAMLKVVNYTGQPVTSTDQPDTPFALVKNILTQTASINTSYANLLDGIDPGEIDEALNATDLAINELLKAKAHLNGLQKRGE